MKKVEVEWSAPEFEYSEKGISWYWLSVIVAVILLSASIWQKNFLFSVFIVIAEILILVWAGKKPRTVKFRIDEKGVTVDEKKFYPYSRIEAFNVMENGDAWSEISFKFSRGLRPLLRTRIPSNLVEEAEKVLVPVVKKSEIEESFFDSLEKLVRF